MKIANWALSAGFLLAQITFGVAAVQCYICSWSPDDKNNRTDVCSDSNFQKNILVINECEEGCEVFIQWDANERMEHVRRNCVGKEDSMKSGCNTQTTGWWFVKRCVCADDLCNNADLSGSSATLCSCSVSTFVLTFLGLFMAKLKEVSL